MPDVTSVYDSWNVIVYEGQATRVYDSWNVVVWDEDGVPPGNSYAYTKTVAYINSSTLKVTAWEVTLTATDPSDSTSANVVMKMPVAPVDQKVFGSWTSSEVKSLADAEKAARGWEAIADAHVILMRDRNSFNPNLDPNA